MKIVTLLISAFILFQKPILAQNYIWPTNTGHYLSSSFGEYRDGHFHSGIDIKTNYRTGYPVFAVANGYVWRVRTSPFGYGKAIYIKLDDGNLAVYGHLDEFNTLLNAYVKAEQLIKKRYTTDIYFQKNEYRVSRGDTIGFTGETGTKHPHLHFEIRNANNLLVNPLNTNLKITDYTIPTIKAIAIVPLNTSSRINGLPKSGVFRAHYIHKNLFTISDTISLSGPVGFEIKTHDTVRGVPNFYSPYGIRMSIDDSLYFHVQYDTFDFSETHLIKIDRDFQLKENGLGNFNRLWFDDYSQNLRFYSNSPGNGKIILKPGQHSVKIQVYDRYMNTSYLNFSIYSGEPFEPALTDAVLTDNQWSLQIDVEEPESTIVRVMRVNPTGAIQQYIDLDTLVMDSTQITIHFSESVTIPGDLIKIECKNRSDHLRRSFYLNPVPAAQTFNDNPKISFIHNINTFLCQVDFDLAPNTTPLFFLQTEIGLISVPVFAINPKTYISDALSLSSVVSARTFEWRYNKTPEKILRTPVHFITAAPDTNVTFETADSVLTVNFPVGSVYDTLICWAGRKTIPVNDKLSFYSDLYTVYPPDRALRSDILLEIKIPAGTEKPEQLGLYKLDDDEWNFLGNEKNPTKTNIYAPTGKLGSFAVIRDNDYPEIHSIIPGNGGRFRFGDIIYISATVKDELSGIDDDKSISVMLDNRPLYVEYNAPRDQIRYKVAGDLPTGQHTLTISVVDRAHNNSTKSSTFTVY